MKIRSIVLVLVTLGLLGGVGYALFRNNGSEEVVGGDRDEKGCLIAAGYSYNSSVKACVRSFELDPEKEAAAQLAVQKVGEGYALTVVSFNPHEKPAAYDVTLEQGEERTLVVVAVRDGRATALPAAPEKGVELGTDGTITKVELPAEGSIGQAQVTFRTDSGAPYTVLVPVGNRSNCLANDKVAEAADAEQGDKVSVRGMTDDEGRIVPCGGETYQFEVRGVYRFTEVGMSFEYRKGPDGYLPESERYQFSEDSSFVQGVLLMNKKESETLLASDVPRENPPIMQVRVYNNPEKLTPADWVKARSGEVNAEASLAEPTEITVGGAAAVGFTTSGLYLIDTYVVAYGEHIIVMTGEYIDTDSPTYIDLERLADSVIFTPGEKQS